MLLAATRPELPREGGERCGFRLAPPLAARGLLPRGRVRLRVLEGPAGLAIGHYRLAEPERGTPLVRLAVPVPPCAPGPEVVFLPGGPFGLYAGPHRLGEGLALHPACSRKGKAALLVLGPGVVLLITGTEPYPLKGGSRRPSGAAP